LEQGGVLRCDDAEPVVAWCAVEWLDRPRMQHAKGLEVRECL